MYNYKDERKNVFTEEGVSMLIAILKNIEDITACSGACTIGKAISTVSGDSFLELACIDYLRERGYITIFPRQGYTTQDSFITLNHQQ